ncbi:MULTISPECIES: 3-oxoacyl-ACP synthase [Mangrovimonas]|uniref:3-oxoacyl-ACP synthase n=1 Tax=Mangrovimonas TaxID=1211036 RepID=UPI00300D3FC5
MIKEELLNICLEMTKTRIKAIQKGIFEIQESMLSETKSSAGDKHETGRAMLQLEREKAGNQLSETEKLLEILNRINPKHVSEKIGLGSVVYTSRHNYYIAVSLGELSADGIAFYAISPNTPMGKILIGKQLEDTINFNGQTFEITKIE